MTSFPEPIVQAVLHHMNDDHNDDSLLIVRAFADGDADWAEMTGFDGAAGHWIYTAAGAEKQASIAWPGGAITERPEVRREIVALYDAACARLGIEPRPH